MPFPLLLRRFLTFGRRSEILGIAYLRSLGYRVVTSGYRTRDGEVDVIAWEGEVLAFVEVKSLQSSEPPEDSVGDRKQKRIIRAAEAYIARHRLHSAPCRFDILSVTVLRGSRPEFRLLRDAFRMYN
ncbi:MAG TPA: YraN family protein [Terriglobia bacterium]|nr:YraN family protein [Terriglobia bacterium]